VVVSVEPGRPITSSDTRRLRWFNFSWNAATGFAFGFLKTDSFVIHGGDPQISVYWNGSGWWEYVVVYRQPYNRQTYVQVLRMAVGAGSFSYWGAVSYADTLGTPAANGSTRDLEIFTFAQ
jgi:hypothetical protein